MRRRSVLLHDERARADAADRELLVALGAHVAHAHLSDGRAARAAAQERQQRLDRSGRPLGVERDGAVVAVANPAEHAELARAPQRRFAKADALDRARHERPNRALGSARRSCL